MHALPFISFVFDVVNVLALHLTFFIIFSRLMFLLSVLSIQPQVISMRMMYRPMYKCTLYMANLLTNSLY